MAQNSHFCLICGKIRGDAGIVTPLECIRVLTIISETALVRIVTKEFGLERFIPASVLDNLKRKEVKKLLGHFLKLHSNMTGSGKQLTQLQVKLHYLDITSQLPSYGAKCFSAAGSLDAEGVIEKVILVSPKFGISQIMGHRNSIFQPVPLANLENMCKIEVRNDEEDEITRIVLVTLDSDKILEITLEEKDALELVLVLKGYYKLLTGKELPVDQEKSTELDEMAPSYLAQHKVIPEKWSYVDQGSLKSASFAVPPGYKNANKKTNGLYNTIGRHCSKKSFNRYDLDGNMNKNNPYIDSIFGNFVDTMIDQSVDDIMEKPANRLTMASEWQETSVDFDSDAELEEAGTLKHSDSLILLNKIHKEDRKMTNGTKDLLRQLQSESDNDNDSLYNPQDSPKCPSKMEKMEDRTSGNSPSFGLRSPNTLDNQNNDQQFREYLRRICEMKNNGSTDSIDMFVFDPDIIDLTFIPPPLTPDELDAQVLPLAIDAPPRPFADSNEHLDTLDLNDNQDLEDFLAKVSVPPPIQKVTPAMELTPEEIMAYIIPPPPEKLSLDSADEEHMIEHGLTRNKSTLHDVLLPKKPEKEEGPIIRPLPRRSFQELPPERPPKEFLKTPPKEVLEVGSTDDTAMPQLPPRNPPGSGLKPQLPPKRLPLIAPLNESNNSIGENRELRDVSTAVGTPMSTTISGKMAAVSIIDDVTPEIDQKHTRKKSENEQKLEELLSSTEQALIELLSRLKRASVKCLGRIQNGDEKESERTKEELTYQSLQLVSASKSLVIAMSEPTLPALLEHLATCLTILRRLTELCQSMETTATVAPPLQTRNLILNVHELVEAFRAFVGSKIDRSTAKTVEEHLAAHAETLANILSTLLRRLKAFPSSSS